MIKYAPSRRRSCLPAKPCVATGFDSLLSIVLLLSTTCVVGLLSARVAPVVDAFFVPTRGIRQSPSVRFFGHTTTAATTRTTSRLYGKKSQRKGAGNARSSQPPQEKQSVKDARFDAATRQFLFTLVGLTKILPVLLLSGRII
jgi:hypothetical protein